MVIWINGPFGSGKTTLAISLLKHLPNAVIFDPESIGFIIHKTVPEARSEDFQNFSMWREHVILFANNLVEQFGKDLIIPMTLVHPEYLSEVYQGLKESTPHIFHFFLKLEEITLRQRIAAQVMAPNNAREDQEIRQWRLDQVDRCLSAIPSMPNETVFLDSGIQTAEEMVENILVAIR